MRKFAEDTTVPIEKSRREIDELMREWGAAGVSWGDSFEDGTVTLRFVWRREGAAYQARVIVKLEPMDQLRAKAKDQRAPWRGVCQAKLDKLVAARGRREHRLLLLWLKAAFNAVEAGLVAAEEVFLPFLEGADGRTVAEVALPRLQHLLVANADRLLPAHGGSGA